MARRELHHFVNLTFCQFNILSTWHFFILTCFQLANLYNWNFVHLTFCQLNFWSTWQFVNLTVCQLDSLSTWQFVNLTVCQLDSLSTWQFVNLTFCQPLKREPNLPNLAYAVRSAQPNPQLALFPQNLAPILRRLMKRHVDKMSCWLKCSAPSLYFNLVYWKGKSPSRINKTNMTFQKHCTLQCDQLLRHFAVWLLYTWAFFTSSLSEKLPNKVCLTREY